MDDHEIVHLGLQALLQDSEFTLSNQAHDAREAKSLSTELQPDLIVLDLKLGGRDGLELLEELHNLVPGAKILVFSYLDEMVFASRALRAGASAYVMKSDGLDKLKLALQEVVGGGIYASDAVRHALFCESLRKRNQPPADPIEGLSNREFQVFQLIGQGVRPAQIATELSLSPKTVSTYLERLKTKLGAMTKRDLERQAEHYLQGERASQA